jgi:cell division protein FtsN
MRYRHAWPGILLLAALAALLVSLVAWGDHFLSPGPPGGIRRLLQLGAASRPAGEGSAPEPSPALLAPAPPPGPAPAPPPAAAGETAAPAGGGPTQTVKSPAPPGEGPAPPRTLAAPPPASAGPGSGVEPAASQARYALDLGTYALDQEAERVEAQLNQAGFSTVRFRQQAPARLFTVLVQPRDAGEGQAVVERLKLEGLDRAVALPGGAAVTVRVAQALSLRDAVQLGERLRDLGYEVRVTAEAARAGEIALRHGNFTSREEAEAASRDLSRLGVPNEVVQIR